MIKVQLTPALPASWRGRTAALVTDLHLGNILGAPFLGRIVSKLESIRPDIIFISGDLFDDTETDYAALLEPWKRLSPPLGAFYVTGNHEEFTQREKFFGPIGGAGIRVLVPANRSSSQLVRNASRQPASRSAVRAVPASSNTCMSGQARTNASAPSGGSVMRSRVAARSSPAVSTSR